MQTSRRLNRLVLLLVAVLACTSVLLGGSEGAQASATGRVRGGIYGHGSGDPKVTMTWFTDHWQYLGKRKVDDGIYSLTLAPGTYRLQFTDRRPAYDTAKYAPTDARVTIVAGSTVQHDITMHRGAAIVGVVKDKKHPSAWSTVVAANTDGQSFSTKANAKGQYAVGGLPAGSYSVFTYDHSRTYVAKSTWVPGLKPGKIVDKKIAMSRRGGRLLIDLYGGDSPLTGSVTVTVTSRSTGQFWTAKSSHGSVTFPDVYPGRYKVIVPGSGSWLGASGAVSGGDVRSGRAAFGSFELTQLGASVTGRVVDYATDPTTKDNYPLDHAQVVLYDQDGHDIGSSYTNAEGFFTIGGPLTTQPDLTLEVHPDPNLGGWMQAASYCRYSSLSVSIPAIVTGQAYALPDPVFLPHVMDASTSSACETGQPNAPTPTPTATASSTTAP